MIMFFYYENQIGVFLLSQIVTPKVNYSTFFKPIRTAEWENKVTRSICFYCFPQGCVITADD